MNINRNLAKISMKRNVMASFLVWYMCINTSNHVIASVCGWP